MLVISEAAIRIGDEAERIYPAVPRRDIRGIGNWLRHAYDRVDPEIMWDTVQADLPRLKNALQKSSVRKAKVISIRLLRMRLRPRLVLLQQRDALAVVPGVAVAPLRLSSFTSSWMDLSRSPKMGLSVPIW